MTALRRTPTILQLEPVECGAAALGMVLGYYGVHLSLDALREACSISRDGSKAKNIIAAAAQYGLEMKGLKRDVDKLKSCHFPAILFWDFNHFVVLEGFQKGFSYINDPAFGRRRVSEQEFSQSYTGIILEAKPLPKLKSVGHRQSDIAYFWERISGHKSIAGLLAVSTILLALLSLVIPMQLYAFVENVLVEHLKGTKEFFLLYLTLATGLTVLIGLFVAYVMRHYYVMHVLKRVPRLLWHLLQLPMAFFDRRFSGDITLRILSLLQLIELSVVWVLPALFSLIACVIIAGILLQYDLLLGSVVVGFCAVFFALSRFVSRSKENLAPGNDAVAARLHNALMGGFRSFESLKAMGQEDSFYRRFWGLYTNKINVAQSSVSLLAINNSLILLGPFALLILLAIVGAYWAIEGHVLLGVLAAFSFLSTLLISQTQRFAAAIGTMHELVFQLKGIDDILAAKEDPNFSQDSSEDAAHEQLILSGALEVKDLSFGYDKSEKEIISGVSFSLPKGSMLGIVGPAGAGKSTLVKLLAGLYTPWSGTVLYDGLTREKIPRDLFCSHVAYAEQVPTLMKASVLDNISYFDESIPQEEIIAAATKAGIHQEILAMPEAYASLIEEDGRNLSGGQKERIELARVLLRKPNVLIFDEALRAVDPIVEAELMATLKEEQCSCIVIAQRLASIRHADWILVLDEGRISQQGTHEALLAQEGLYKRLVEHEGGLLGDQ